MPNFSPPPPPRVVKISLSWLKKETFLLQLYFKNQQYMGFLRQLENVEDGN